MSIVSGVVRETFSRKWGNKTFWSFNLVNEDTNYGLGVMSPKFKPGDFVKFEASQNEKGYWQADGKSISVKKGTGEVKSAPSANGLSKDAYWSNKESRDIRNDRLREIGASRNTAIAWLTLLLDKGAITLPKKVAEQEGFLAKLLDDYTVRFMQGLAVPAEETVAEPAPSNPVEENEEQEGEENEWN